MVTTQTAISAYQQALKNAQSEQTSQTNFTQANQQTLPLESQGTFGNMVQNYLQKTVDSNLAAEEMSIKAIRGEAELTDVVTAVANAEAALRTVITVRDRVIKAYDEIIRMPI